MVAVTQTSTDAEAGKLSTERITDGNVTCLRFSGTIDESFDGKRLASTIKTSVLILHMAEVVRVSSFGIREWADFLKAVERGADSILMVECSPRVVDQINMVANFAGKGRVYSFQAPYRCDFCDRDWSERFLIDRDGASIRSFKPREASCDTCGREAYFDEDPVSFFTVIAGQPVFELPKEAADFLASKLDHAVAAADRALQVEKYVEGRNTYVRLSGSLDGSFPSEKVAEGLEGEVVIDVSGIGTLDIAGTAEWRNFITLARVGADRLSILDCSPVLLDRLSRQEDLGDQVLSFSIPYGCKNCSTTTAQIIDVEQNYDILRFATPPEMKCDNCKKPSVCTAPESLLSRLRSLPKPVVDSGLRAFIKTVRKRAQERQVAAREKPDEDRRSPTSLLVIGGVGMLAVAAVGVFLVLNYYQQRETQSAIKDKLVPEVLAPTGPSKQDRPPWITSDIPYFGTCTDSITRITCLGVSPFMDSKEEALEQARSVALEEMLNTLSVRIEHSLFDAQVRPQYSEARREELLAFDRVRGDRFGDEYKRIFARVRNARDRSVHAAMAAHGSLIPAQHSAWYWEEYDKPKGHEGIEYLVFVRYDIGVEAAKDMVASYTEPEQVAGSEVIVAFPLLAWSYPDFSGGVHVLKPRGKLKRNGVEAGAVIASVGGHAVESVQSFSELMDEAGSDLELQLATPTGDGVDPAGDEDGTDAAAEGAADEENAADAPGGPAAAKPASGSADGN